MKAQTFASFCLIPILSSLPMSLAASPDRACLELAWQAEIDVQIALQDEISGMVIAAQPDLKEIAELSAASAKQNLTMTHEMRRWIWKTDPARLNTLEAHNAFSWTEDDRAAWVSADTNAAALQVQLDDLNAQLAAHSDLNSYFTFLGEEAQQAQMLEITQDFGEHMIEASTAVANCF